MATAAAILAAAAASIQAHAQLAITEVMAQGTLSCNSPDYWELTNFGTNSISLSRYRWEDNQGTLDPPPWTDFADLDIGPGKSVIFLRCQPGRSITNSQTFRDWWGPANLPPTLQDIRCYEGPGLNEMVGDEVWLYDDSNELVDMVSFGRSTFGHSFTYYPDTGIFGVVSLAGVNGAVQAASCPGDVGSPGQTTGAVPLSILDQPQDQDVDAGTDVTLAVLAAGLPRAHHQWRRNGTNIPGATAPNLTISNVQPSEAGEYDVRLSNYFGTMLSRTAIVRVNTNCLCAQILQAPSDATVFPGQTNTFSIVARGYPPPIYQWSSNGVNIAGATNRSYTIPTATLDMSGTTYRVMVRNGAGAQCPPSAFSEVCFPTNVSALLTVTRRPILKITELMPAPSLELEGVHNDWFELTNDDTNAVNLQGYKFANGTDPRAFKNAFRITNTLILQPGRSVVFVKNMTPAQFSLWWGAENLPRQLQIQTFSGFSLDGIRGEELYLWNAAAINADENTVANTCWAGADIGISVEFLNDCYEDFGCVGYGTTRSIVGANGAFRATDGGDIGSPGYTINPPPRFLQISRGPSEVNIRCRVIEGKSYRLRYSDRLSNAMPSSGWAYLGRQPAMNSLITLRDTTAGSATSRFYRLEELP